MIGPGSREVVDDLPTPLERDHVYFFPSVCQKTPIFLSF